MRDLQVGQTIYRMSDSDAETALAHALGRTFIELQQLEFSIVSFLNLLAGGASEPGPPFDVFASKTFGNLVREMRKHTFLKHLADEMQSTKETRDFFVHRFLFHRYGGPMMTTDEEYELLIREAHSAGNLLNRTRHRLDDFMVDKSPLAMFVATADSETGEITIRQSAAMRGEAQT
jgi:hypothetical protein